MCQCSGLLKEKAGYFERLKIFLKVTGLLRTYDMKIENWKWRPFEGSSRFVSLTAFGGPWHDGGGRGVGGRRSSQSRVSEVKTIEGSTSPLSQYYQVSVISYWGKHRKNCYCCPGLRILIWPLEVPFFWSENGHFWPKVTKKNGTSSGQIKILRPLL